jgi:hypothetical protein
VSRHRVVSVRWAGAVPLIGSTGLAEAAGRTFDVYGVHGISVELAIGVSVLEACRASRRLARHPRLRLSTVQRVRSEGFALLATFEHPHFTVVLPDVAEFTLARLERSFDKPIPNPARGAQG